MKYLLGAILIFMVIGGYYYNVQQMPNCDPPNDSELLSAAIDENLSNQADSISIPLQDGSRKEIKFRAYTDRSEFLRLNPDCCRIFTKEARAEYINPEFAKKKNHNATVRVQARRLFIDNDNFAQEQNDLRQYVKLIHFDKCGKVIDLD